MSLLRDLVSPVLAPAGPARPASLRTGPLGRFDYWSLGLIAVVAIVLLARLDHLKPSMSDTWYHLGVAHRIVADGEIPGWDWWNYAPLGRPHLYPPLLHLIIAFLAKLSGSVITAGQLCAALFLPGALLTTWYCARRLLNPAAAFVAILILLTDLFHFVVMEAYIAGCLVNILLPLLVVTFVARRPWWSILLLTLMYYSHLGFPHCVALGLLVFGYKYRPYLRLALKVVGISFIFYTPWLSHVLGNLDWLPVLEKAGMPGGMFEKMLSLQMFNLVLLGLGFWGIAVAPRTSAARMLPVYMLIGFLPILFSYGGRFFMHTMPMWALLGAGVAGRLLPPQVRTRRIIGIALLTLVPVPSISVMKDKIAPMPITGSHLLLVVAFSGDSALSKGDKSEAYREDCEQLAQWLKTATRPDEIIHVNTVWLADMISLLSDRPTDFGAWWECSKESAKLYGKALRDWDPGATFVCIKPENDAGSVLWDTPLMPGVDHRYAIGRFEIGIRDPVSTRPIGRTVKGWKALSAPGAAGDAYETKDGLVWMFPRGRGKLALVSAPFTGPPADGISFRVRCNQMCGDVVLGARLADGTDLRWPVSIPEAEMRCGVRALFSRMTDEKGSQHPVAAIREVYLACPPETEQSKRKRTELRLEVTDLQLLKQGQ
jgi:hypothetical protein